MRWPTSLRSGWPRRAGKWPSSRPPSSPAPSPANSSPKTQTTSRRKNCWNGFVHNPNPNPAGTPENSPAIHRWVMAQNDNESRQGRKKSSPPSGPLFRPCGAWPILRRVNPAINRWAIFECPCGTKSNKGVEYMSDDWTRMIPDSQHQSPGGTNENSPPIRRWVPVRERNESRQGRKKTSLPAAALFRPCGACSSLHPQPTVETVGYCRSSLAGPWNPFSNVSCSSPQSGIVRILRGVRRWVRAQRCTPPF